ncbi:MAG TPA: murein biosynthesis integral membrane protein MurJ [Caulobacterales bacterium]|jgi:putative peptidoglycan lipid II flippase|nr:murein biosynthesis integral membrane protein MurJ [Caulobacterales bacterium]
MSLARNAFVQASLTMASRILGFARDLMVAARFGQGPYSDIWATALMFPNLFRRLFAEGAFAQAFVPVYAKVQAESGDAEAERIASDSLSFLLFVVGAVCIVMQVAMPWIMHALLSAYVDRPEIFTLAIFVTQITMPYLFFMTMASLLSGVLNTRGKFALSAAVLILFNLCTLAPLVLMPPGRVNALYAVGAAVTVSGVLQAGFLWWGVRRAGVRLGVHWPRLTAGVKQILALAVPGAIAGGATQINSLVSQALTGSDEGARSVLYNSDRLYQLPLGIVGTAIGLALVPRLTRAFALKDQKDADGALDDGVALSMAFSAPAAVALFVMPYLIIDSTLTRGAFTHADAHRTAAVLFHFAWGVPAFVLAKVFTPPFFARQDTKRPMRYALITVALNVVLGVSLFFGMSAAGMDGVIGLGIATSAAAWVNIALLTGTLAREGAYKISARLWGRLLRIGVACLVLGGFLAVCALNYRVLTHLLWRKEIVVLAVSAAGALLYAALAFASGAVTWAEVRGALRRERGGAVPAGDLPIGLDG